MSDDSLPVVAKPDELLALHSVTEELFNTLKRWFSVPDSVSLDLTDIDAVVSEMSDPVMIAALAMRKLQALRLLSTPGVRTSTDVVLAIVNDLERAMIQAPAMRLKLRASTVDWDAALADLQQAQHPSRAMDLPHEITDADPEADRFRALHLRLHEAAMAVYEAGNGEIRLLE
ncbi:MAG TPA: hypothetical protein VF183_08155 [Acidimicrobiales bacterium]